MKRIYIVIIFFIILNLSCFNLKKSSDNSLNFFPRESDIPGWRAKNSPQLFRGGDIRKYLKDSGDHYQRYNVEELSVAEYNSISDPSRIISLAILKMSSSLNAFGIFSLERGFDYKDACISEDSYLTSNGLFFRKGRYYIKIEIRGGYADVSKDFRMFSGAINDKVLKGRGVIPDYLSLFSDKGSRSRVVYYIEDYPLLPSIKNIFVRKKDISGDDRFIFFGRRNSYFDSMRDFSAQLKIKENPFILSNAGKLRIAFNKIADNEYIFISVYKKWVFGVISANSMIEGKKIVTLLYKDLLDYLKKG